MMSLVSKAYKLNKVEEVERLGKVYNIEQVGQSQDKVYNVNNGVLAFIHDGSTHVMPVSDEALEKLKESGYMKFWIYVPFSNFDKPTTRRAEYDKVFVS